MSRRPDLLAACCSCRVFRAARQVLDKVILWKGVSCAERGGGARGDRCALHCYLGGAALAEAGGTSKPHFVIGYSPPEADAPLAQVFIVGYCLRLPHL